MAPMLVTCLCRLRPRPPPLRFTPRPSRPAPVTFFVAASASSLASLPKQTQSGTTALGNGTATIAQKGALLTAAASIVRYFQNRGDLPAPGGLADPATLNQFLKSFCVADA